MRQLFLPACVCLVTWSGATNSDPRFTLDEFSDAMLAKQSVSAPSRSETVGAASKLAREEREADAAVVSPVKLASLTPDDFAPRMVDDTAEKVATAPSEELAPKLSDEDIAAIMADLAIESPVPSGKVINNGVPAGIPLPPIAKSVIARSEEEVCGSLTDAAQRNGLPAPFFIRLLFQESRFKPGVVSSAGAQGIAQFMPATAADVGLDNPFDPLQAIPASARLLRNLFEQFGNLGLAAAAYNAGPRRIQDWLADRRKNKLPEETQGYVKTITGKPVESWSTAAARHPGVKLPQRAPCQEAAGLLAWNGPDALPMPEPAPHRTVVTPAKLAETKLADSGKKDKAEVETKVKTAKAADAKTSGTDHSKTEQKAVAKVDPKTDAKSGAKTAAKAVSGKPAASKLAARKHKQKPERVAQR